MAETLNCTALHGMLTPPANPRARQRFRRAVALNRAQQPVRKIWDCILFGFEMPLLLLHMQTLEAVVDGFLVTESTTCFQTSKAKPAVLSNALAAGSLPVALAKMTTVRVITLEEGKDAGCRDMALPSRSSGGSADGGSQSRSYSGRCFQSVQRLALLTLLAQKAAPDDLAFVADVDEIVAPRLVSLLRTCAPFPPFEDWHRHGVGAAMLRVAATTSARTRATSTSLRGSSCTAHTATSARRGRTDLGSTMQAGCCTSFGLT
jgi:hypothetical protein